MKTSDPRNEIFHLKKIFLGNFNPRLKTGKIDACFSRQNGLRLVCPREETLRHMILYFPILWRNLCSLGMTFTYRAHLHGVGYPRQPSLKVILAGVTFPHVFEKFNEPFT